MLSLGGCDSLLGLSAGQWLLLKGGTGVVFLLCSSPSDISIGPSPLPQSLERKVAAGVGQGLEITALFPLFPTSQGR